MPMLKLLVSQSRHILHACRLLLPVLALSSPRSIDAAALGCRDPLAAGCGLALVKHGPVAGAYVHDVRLFLQSLVGSDGKHDMHACR